MKAQYNIIYFDTKLYESELVVKGAETTGYNLIVKNKDLLVYDHQGKNQNHQLNAKINKKI